MQLLAGQGYGNQRGGLGGLLENFRQAGLGHVADSWVSTGGNEPVAPDQLERVFGRERVENMAQDAGMPTDSFLSQLRQHLPREVDGMTPNGQVPQEGSISV